MSRLRIPKNIKMVISDFDGIMTDNTVIINEDFTMSRRLNFKDIMAVSMLKKAGVELAIISGEKNSAIQIMAEKFDLKEIHQGIRVKIDVLKDILERSNLKPEEVIFIGDDINDIECLNYVGTKITVGHAVDAVKKVKGIQITSQAGGSGAFREVVDCLLNS